MKNKIRFEDLTHLILLFMMFLIFATTFLSMKINEEEKELAFCGVTSESHGIDYTEGIYKGKKLFKSNCGSCHASDMASNLTGPALGGVQERWKGKEDNLRVWIRNSVKYLVENPNDEYVQKLYVKWNENVMPAHNDFKDEEIENILSYIDAVYTQ